MSDGRYGSLENQRQKAEDLLSEAFAKELITLDELEQRLVAVNKANDREEIGRQVRDLAVTAPVAPVQDLPDLPSEPLIAKSIMSSRVVRGNQLRQSRIIAKTIMAEQKFDYSKTVLQPGKYYIDAKVIMGSMTILVPEDYAVTMQMETIMADVSEKDTNVPDGRRPEIIIRGKAIMAEVRVRVARDGIVKTIKNLLEKL